VEQELSVLPQHLSSVPVFSGVCVTRSLVLWVCFVDLCLSFFFWSLCCLFFFDIRILMLMLKVSRGFNSTECDRIRTYFVKNRLYVIRRLPSWLGFCRELPNGCVVWLNSLDSGKSSNVILTLLPEPVSHEEVVRR